MLVCPSCRQENFEDARFCSVCGRSLEPVATPMRRTDRGEQPDALEVEERKRSSPWPAITLAVVLALGLVAWGAWSTAKPDPCQGRYASALFPYCATIPEGWIGGSQVGPVDNYDQFIPDTEEAPPLFRVEVQQVLDPATATEQYVQQFRITQEATGITPGQVEVVPLDGEQALGWNYTLPADELGPALRLREVVAVRPEGAWRLTLITTDETFTEARLAFELFLESWRWEA